MSNIAFEMDHVYKKFRKGEIYSSLRDLIPALTSRLWKKNSADTLEKREFWALKDISFQVKRGEALGIIGANGAGKSTILKLTSGIMNPTKGRINVNGKISALIEVGAGFHEDLTGRENIFLNGTILGMTKDEIKVKIDKIIDFSGLNDFIDTPVKRYSSGMYARLGFAVAAHVDPDILIIDEVLSVGDAIFQKQCLEKMNSVIKGGSTVIFVSHNLKAVAELCDRCILLDHGKIVKSGNTQEVIKYYFDIISSPKGAISDKPIFISKCIVRDSNGECMHYQSGQKAWIDIEITANERYENLGLVLEVKDDSYHTVFDTSTYRLGAGTFSIKQGEKFICTFELDMHFASGVFHIGATLHQYDIRESLHAVFPAATIFVSADRDVLGAVNLYPTVVTRNNTSSYDRNLASMPCIRPRSRAKVITA
jgi:ABC-type polysaccharide/polyol phosphate transport system ATPase subunit